MISSPPEEAEHVRGKTLTPESPKPLHYPSPANIPILEKQMDPLLNEPALSIGTPASFQYPQQTQTPSARSPTYYPDGQSAQSLQNASASASLMSAFNGAMGAQPQTQTQPHAQAQAQAQAAPSLAQGQTQGASSNNTFSMQHQATSHSDAASAPSQEAHATYPFAYDASAYAAQQPQAQPPAGEQFHNAAALDVQALLDKLSTPTNNAAPGHYATPAMPSQPTQPQAAPSASTSTLPAAPNLPPRPPPQAKPTTHPNYNPNDDIRSYHPHSGHRGSTQLQTVNTRGAGDEGAKRSNLSPNTPTYPSRQSLDAGRSATPDEGDEDVRWPPEVNKLYEEFLDQERRYVTEGQWDQFPAGSRLFIGNLPTEKVTKRDIFHRFYRHGQLAQISIKQAYGFVQFLYAESCAQALRAEQGQQVRGRKMHLEISKPQRNTKKGDSDRNNGSRRRSRSPDYGRGGSGPAPRDHYGRNQSLMSPRDRDNRRFRDRERDDYRPMRSPSPRDGRGYRGRDRSRDRYDARRRSRSRSPRRYRSPSPRPRDGLPLPTRKPHEVPEVQILAQDALPKDFVQWVEDGFHDAGLRVDVLRMSPRLDEMLVEQRQILEGVLVIVRLDAAALASGKISLQIFDRRDGPDNIKFDKFANLDLPTAIALVQQAKQKSQQPVHSPLPPVFGQVFGGPPVASSVLQSPLAANPGNLTSLLSSVTPEQLSQLLAAMPRTSAPQTPQTPQTQAAALTPELARLLGTISAPAQAPAYNNAVPPPQPYASPYPNQAYPQQYGSQPPAQPPAPPAQPPASQPDMNEIMAQLARYQR